MRTCRKCFRTIDEGIKFCPHCGWDQSIDPHTGKNAAPSGERVNWSAGGTAEAPYRANDRAQNTGSSSAAGESTGSVIYSFPQRNIAMDVVFSILTGGLYILWWIYRLTCDFNEVSRLHRLPSPGISPGLVVLLAMLTGGLFMVFYWFQLCRQAAALVDVTENNLTDYSALCAICAVTGPVGNLVGCAVMQNVLNLYTKYKL